MNEKYIRIIPSDYQALIESSLDQKNTKILQPLLQQLLALFIDMHHEFVDIQTLRPNHQGNYVTGRYPANVFTVEQAEFKGYPAAKISTGDVIAEGPTQESNELLLNCLLTQKIDIIFAVGKPSESGDGEIREKYFTYFSSQNLIHSSEFFRKLEPLINFENYFEDSQIKIYSERNFFVIHLPNWPDHGLPDFTVSDKKLLALIFLWMIKNNKRACFHCSAGIGRSPALLFAKLLFEKALENPADLTNLKLMEQLLRDIKNVKPGAGEWWQILAAMGLVEDLLIYSKRNLSKFSTT